MTNKITIHNQLHKIDQFITALPPETKEALDVITVSKQFKKDEYLLQKDEICRNSYWIEKGALRKFYLAGEKEISTELLFENDMAISMHSYTLQVASNEYIQALEDTIVSCTSYIQFQQLKKRFPELIQLDLLLTEYYALWLEERLFCFHTMDATTRYRLLLHEHPEMIQKVQLTYIASYLGISLETLSRIRAKL
jgi:signal-transduction protein with cAMP-binding, CBS, and nucleotidyltransferase domain